MALRPQHPAPTLGRQLPAPERQLPAPRSHLLQRHQLQHLQMNPGLAPCRLRLLLRRQQPPHQQRRRLHLWESHLAAITVAGRLLAVMLRAAGSAKGLAGLTPKIVPSRTSAGRHFVS